MDTFRLHEHEIKSYRDYLSSFINIRDDRIRRYVEEKFESEGFIATSVTMVF